MIRKLMFPILALPLALSSISFLGCGQGSNAPGAKSGDVNTDVTATLAELSEDDHRLALAQKYCPVHEKNLLGSMGKPFKLMMAGQPVFLCCADCKADAERDPKATLAKVTELKRVNASPK
jgi:hypothetical protein